MLNVAVIGCGVIGLTSAVQIQNDIKNVNVTIFTEKLSPETTGDLSAGLWTPYLLGDTSEHDIVKWSKATHDYLTKLWKEGYACEAGICLQPVLRLYTEKESELEKWSTVPFGYQMLTTQQLQKLSRQHGSEYKAGLHYVSYTCEPSKFLPFLMDKFLTNGGNLKIKKINNFSQLSNFDVIVNSTGLEARRLTGDEHVHPIRGQICRVKAPWQFQVVMNDVDEGFYIIPNTSCVILGGTHQIGNENLSTDQSDKIRILKGCTKIIPGLNNCRDHKDGVGLRPGRSQVRLEIEKIPNGNRTTILVHNYGHGGAGVTLCIGCAKDVSILIQKTIQLQSHL